MDVSLQNLVFVLANVKITSVVWIVMIVVDFVLAVLQLPAHVQDRVNA